MAESRSASVDGEACKGHGRCYMTAPDLFDADDEGFAVVVGEATTAAQVAGLERAVSNCPERAISAAFPTTSH